MADSLCKLRTLVQQLDHTCVERIDLVPYRFQWIGHAA
jgi:hypothetical protein